MSGKNGTGTPAIPDEAHGAALIEAVIARGDLAKLAPVERVRYYMAVCEACGLNPLTKPFDYLHLNGRLVLYPTRGATDQLRQLHGITCEIVSRDQVGDLYVVHVRVTAPDGRRDEDIGVVALRGLSGDALANAIMKAITKAKRRATLSLLGLNMVDETEVETIPEARPVAVDIETGEILEPVTHAPSTSVRPATAKQTIGGAMRALHAAAAKALGKSAHEYLHQLAAAIYGVPSLRELGEEHIAALRRAVEACDEPTAQRMLKLAQDIAGAGNPAALTAIGEHIRAAELPGPAVALLRMGFGRVRQALAIAGAVGPMEGREVGAAEPVAWS